MSLEGYFNSTADITKLWKATLALFNSLYCIVLHCIALHCSAVQCSVLFCIVLYCIVFVSMRWSLMPNAL